MTTYGRSPWIQAFPKTRVPEFPPYRGAADADVVIIGGGLTGCATAYALAAAGVKVTLLESAQIGRGSTASAFGLIAEDPGVSFLEAQKAMGNTAARHAFKSWRRAALDMSALLRRLGVKCDLQPRSVVVDRKSVV